jgi:16S rRNA (cytosine967-C5)-methyltransferase
MKRSSLIGHVIELHDAIRASKQPADIVVREFIRSRHYLGSKDRRFITEMVFGLIRNFKLINVYAEETLRLTGGATLPRTVPSVVLIAVYCVRVIDETIDNLLPDLSGLWRVYVPDTNCERFLSTLSSVALPEWIGKDAGLSIATRYSFPESVVQEWIERYGADETEQLCASLNAPSPITVRVNTLATTVEHCEATLKQEGIEAHRTALSPVGLTLSKRINAQALQSFKSGYFEMQDEGSQLLSMLVQPSSGMTVVDACAGGGGKTLHLAALMQNSGAVIAIDVDQQRLMKMQERLHRAGVSIVRTYVAAQDQGSIDEFKGRADTVLIDAPCSGVGTFRRNPGTKSKFTDTFVDSMALMQRNVLEKYSTLVKPGGRLVYSTCTLLKKENEDQVSAFLEQHSDFELVSGPAILLQQGVSVDSSPPFLTLLPHKTTTDGFFAAVMIRR